MRLDQPAWDALSEMVRTWPAHAVHRLAKCLEAAGCVKPTDTANWVHRSTNLGKNKNKVGGLASSTYSDRLMSIDLNAFEDGFNGGLAVDVNRTWASSPPDPGSLAFIVDGHEQSVTSTMQRRLPGRKPSKKAQQKLTKKVLRQTRIELVDMPAPPPPVPLSQKRAHIVAAHSSNKLYPFCLPYIVVAATWTHKGRRLTVLLGICLSSPLLRSPVHHLKFLGKLLERLDRRPDCVILDRAYDSGECRRVLAELGLLNYTRLKTRDDAKRHCWDARTGAHLDLNAELAKTALMDLPAETITFRDETGRRVKARQKVRTLDVRLERDGKPFTAVLRAAYKVDFGAKAAFDRKHSFLLAAPLGEAAQHAVDLYAVRWRIETWLNQATSDKPATRAKGINAQVVQFYAFLYRIQLGIVAKFRLVATGVRRLGRRVIAGIAASVVGLWVTGHEDPPDRG